MVVTWDLQMVASMDLKLVALRVDLLGYLLDLMKEILMVGLMDVMLVAEMVNWRASNMAVVMVHQLVDE